MFDDKIFLNIYIFALHFLVFSRNIYKYKILFIFLIIFQQYMAEENNKVVLVEGKLSKIIHAQGEGDFPKKGQEVHALYRGTLETGQQFDSNQDRDSPFKFTLGQGQVIKGWDEGFASMRKGQKATLICSPEYAYEARGSPPKIPPNATLHFEVQLLDFNDKKKQKWDLSADEKIQEAVKCKNEGNEHLKKGEFAQAIKKYEEGIQYVDSQEDANYKSTLKVLRMNASQAYLKHKQYAKAIELCTKVLKDDPDNVKTLYRRGVAYLNNQDYDLAKNDIDHVLRSDPQNAEAKQELAKIIQGKKKAAEKEKKVFGGMFNKPGLYDDVKPQEKKPKAKDETDSEDDMPELQKDQEPAQEKKQEPQQQTETKMQQQKPQQSASQ